LLAKSAIVDAMYRYCRGVDRGDEELIGSVYHPDGIDDHGVWKGCGSDFAKVCVERIGIDWVGSAHMLGNILIEFVRPDVARVESYFIANRRKRDDPRILASQGGRYIDRFEERDGEWRIAYRRVGHDWSSIGEITTQVTPDTGFPQGRCDRSDLVYLPDEAPDVATAN
jgi:hypothetical protein